MPRFPRLAALLLAVSLGLPGCAALEAQESRSARPYLVQALQAVERHDRPAALRALNEAESRWVAANTPVPSLFFPFDPSALRDMGRARQSVQTERWGDAEYWVRTALTRPSVVRPG